MQNSNHLMILWLLIAVYLVHGVRQNSWSRAQSTEKSLMISFTKRHLLRCYPAGRRICPTTMILSQLGLLALRWLHSTFRRMTCRPGSGEASFSANGGSGYILKPKHLLDPSAPKPSEPVCALSVSVIAGSGWDNFQGR